MPGLTNYTNDGLNNGPFNITIPDDSQSVLEYIINPRTNKKVNVNTPEGKKIWKITLIFQENNKYNNKSYC